MTFLALRLFFVGSKEVGLMVRLKRTQNSALQDPHDAAGVADPGQVGGDVLPNADAALADALSGRQLHEEERNADNQQKKNIQQHEGPWRKRRRSSTHEAYRRHFFPSNAFTCSCVPTSSPLRLDAHRLHFGGKGTGISTRSRVPR